MTTRQTPGRRLKRLLDAALADGCSWTEQEQVAIDKAVRAQDRAAALQRLLDAELAKPLPSSRKATELAGEIRQLEATVVKLVGMLVPDHPRRSGRRNPPSTRPPHERAGTVAAIGASHSCAS